MEYEKMLKKAMEKLPQKAEEKARFETPKAKILPAGARTIIINFYEIASALRREPKYFLKELLRELATKGEIKDKRLVVIGRFSEEMINRKIESYVKKYVLCPECAKPDTKIVRKDGTLFLVCEACGASNPLV